MLSVSLQLLIKINRADELLLFYYLNILLKEILSLDLSRRRRVRLRGRRQALCEVEAHEVVSDQTARKVKALIDNNQHQCRIRVVRVAQPQATSTVFMAAY